jgi:hypothetical protein
MGAGIGERTKHVSEKDQGLKIMLNRYDVKWRLMLLVAPPCPICSIKFWV